jgi:hypothetical protein
VRLKSCFELKPAGGHSICASAGAASTAATTTATATDTREKAMALHTERKNERDAHVSQGAVRLAGTAAHARERKREKV